MLFLLLAILSSAMVSIVMRVSSGRISANLSMLATNYLICSLLGAAYAGFDLAAAEDPGFSSTVIIGLISGVLYLGGFVAFQANTNKRGIVLSSVFMKLGLLVPIVVSVLFFKEIPTAVQITGFFIAIVAIVLINLKKDDSGKGFGFGLILMLLLSGGADVMAKVFDVFAPRSHSALYLFYNFATAFILCLLLVIRKKERPGFRELLYGTLIGIPNFFSAKFLLGALEDIAAVVVYPVYSVATILTVTVTGILVFRERLDKRQWTALAMILVALVLLNV
jgi:drug/metabolite transporter (DMT)-like permease